MKKKLLSVGLVVLSLLLISGSAVAQEDTIVAFWFEWAPADLLEKLSEGFTKETGIKFVMEVTAAENWVQKYNTEMIAQSDAWDLIIADSQDIGTMSVGKHFVELTDWIKEREVDKTFTEASMRNYAEYPKGSQKYWGVPCEGDAIGWAYRKDLFEDPKNKAAFKEKYGYELDVPSSLDMLKDIAEFFHDPDNAFYGVAIYGDNGYDSLAMFAEQSIWSFGGELGDYSTYKVDGLLNSPGAVAGIEYYHELFKFTPPGFGDAFFVKCNDAYVAGRVAMVTNYFAFFPGLANEATNPYAKMTGYFANPPQKGPDGVERQVAALGGMSVSINNYSKKKDLAMKWLEWFIRPDVQMEWARIGGFTCHAEALGSDEFMNATPYNAAFKKSMEIFRDFWADPEYSVLLRTFSENLGPYVILGEGTAKEALDTCVKDWEEIFEEAGYYDN